MRKSIITVLAALSASIATPAAAEWVTVTVNFDDLDLTSPADVATLDQRIAEAVEEVCDKVEPFRLRGEIAWQKCKATSLADAKRQQAAFLPPEN